MKLEVISKLPTANAHPTPLLFVHGLWLGAWCWDEYFLDYFCQRGYAAYAVSLRGHGQSEGHERIRWTRFSEYIQDIAQVANQFHMAPVLIGHSNGGALVQKYLETHSAPAGVLVASVPPSGISRASLHVATHYPGSFLKANATLSLLPLVDTPEKVHGMFFASDVPEAQLRSYTQRMQEESFRAFLDILALDLPRSTRVKTRLLVLGAEKDFHIDPAQVRATAFAYRTEPVIFPNMGHAMMLETGWQAVADRILAWLAEKDL